MTTSYVESQTDGEQYREVTMGQHNYFKELHGVGKKMRAYGEYERAITWEG